MFEVSTAYDATNSQNRAIEKGKRFELQIWTAYEASTAYDVSNRQNKAIEKWNLKLSLYKGQVLSPINHRLSISGFNAFCVEVRMV